MVTSKGYGILNLLVMYFITNKFYFLSVQLTYPFVAIINIEKYLTSIIRKNVFSDFPGALADTDCPLGASVKKSPFHLCLKKF